MDKNTEKKKSQFASVVARLRKNGLSMFGLGILVTIVIMAIFVPMLSPYTYDAMDFTNLNALPSAEHWFGTDDLGRDIFTRCFYGARYSLTLGLLAEVIGKLVGIVIGLIAGYFGGNVDNIILRILDVIQSIPGMLLAIIISTVLGNGFGNTILAMSIGGVPMTVRLLRAQILSIRKEEYLEAAEAIDCPKWRIMVSHIFPNAYSPLLVSLTMGIGNAVTSAAGLSYIGLGVQQPTPEWGAMLSAARGNMRYFPHEIIFPGLMIALTVLALNLFGDGLRDALDPKLKN